MTNALINVCVLAAAGFTIRTIVLLVRNRFAAAAKTAADAAAVLVVALIPALLTNSPQTSGVIIAAIALFTASLWLSDSADKPEGGPR